MANAEERAKKAEEKAARAAKKEPATAVEPPVKAPAEENPKSDSGGLNTTQWLTLGSIAVGLIGIYYKCEELKAVADKIMGPKALPPDGNGDSLPQPSKTAVPSATVFGRRGCR